MDFQNHADATCQYDSICSCLHKGKNSKFPYPFEDIALIAGYGSNPDTRSWDWDFYVAELSSVWVSFVGDSEIPGLHSLAASPGYHYTMVLDSDTVCPAKSIRKLLETAEHSANQLLSSTSSSKNCFESVGILLKIGIF